MLTILMYAFPAMLFIVALYLLFFRSSLETLLKLDNHRLLNGLIMAFASMGLVGFLLNLAKLTVLIYIWMVLALLLVACLSYILYQAVK
ncbi:hypothetical protein [Vaginisenegalia massiliensis]|uniref:hypothetical protein n=1 Tax=Vaginisenegalia massiliensis TaxID=2058294 RepID=UPI000F52555E|nr:hypothetical protein [Vaginisenegalia massiliensis]